MLTTMRHISLRLLSGVLLLSLASCINDNYIDDVAYTDGKVAVEMSIQTRSLSSITSNSQTYVPGTEWENYVDFAGGDYRIYFFEYDPTTETGSGSGESSKLIAKFTPTTIYSTDLDTYTTYTLSGELDEDLVAELDDFKVVVVANWGTYPTVTAGTTTIDDICKAETAVFDAFVDASGNALMPSSSLHIPFFGLREYSGVSWREGTMTRLSGDITLLRSLAKVEVILETDSEVDSFDDVSIVNYNSQGYCAPANVYLRSDYDHDYTWSQDFTESIHIADSGNDTGTKSFSFRKTQETEVDETTGEVTQYETWVAYVPEYDNTGTDYSYITVTIENDLYRIYFGNYDEDGYCTAYDTDGDADDRYDVYRNYLYRFHVTYTGGRFRVVVNKWEDTHENVFDYVGETVLTEDPEG